jgi:hypothetical protein
MPRKPKKLSGVAAIGTVAAAAVMFVIPGAPNPVEALECPPLHGMIHNGELGL